MKQYLYTIRKLYSQSNIIYIDSTFYPYPKINNYATYEPIFNNQSHEIHIFEITKSDLSCYTIDELLRRSAYYINKPYQKFNGRNTKHYYYTNIDDLKDFLTKIDVEFNHQQLDVTKFCKDRQPLQYIAIREELGSECNLLDDNLYNAKINLLKN